MTWINLLLEMHSQMMGSFNLLEKSTAKKMDSSVQSNPHLDMD